MSKKLILLLIIIMFSAFITSGVILYTTGGIDAVKANSYKINQEEVFSDINDVTDINIKATNPEINIINTDNNEIKVNLVGELNGLFYKKNYELVASKINNQINIEANGKINGFFILSSNVKLNIYLPMAYNDKLKLEVTNGEIILSERNFKELTLKTTNGKINLNNVFSQSGQITTTNGSIVANDLTGKHTLSSTNGNITLTVKDTYDLKITTTNGRVKVNNINDCKINLSTINGNINNIGDFNGTQNRKNASGVIGNEFNKVSITTTNGDIKVNY